MRAKLASLKNLFGSQMWIFRSKAPKPRNKPLISQNNFRSSSYFRLINNLLPLLHNCSVLAFYDDDFLFEGFLANSAVLHLRFCPLSGTVKFRGENRPFIRIKKNLLGNPSRSVTHIAKIWYMYCQNLVCL